MANSESDAITTIDLLRHGRTTQDDIFRGRVNTPLSEEGYQQMQASLGDLLTTPPWQQIVTSPLQRCRDFARDLADRHQLRLHEEAGFIEMDFGDWDGQSFASVRAQYPELMSKIWRDPHNYSPPNGETFAAFSARIVAHWHTMIAAHQNQHLLLVCHGGVIRTLLSYVMQAPASAMSRIEVPYASFSRIKVYHHPGAADWPQLVFHR